MTLAIAGRRIDPEHAAEPRFPLENVDLVKQRVRELLVNGGATAIIGSAACGADLVALVQAGELGIRRRVVLPFNRDRFRKTSVTDRPGEWGALYDQVLDAVQQAGDLVVLENASDDEAYQTANTAILDQAQLLGHAAAVLIWEGSSRGDNDMTESFGTEARKRGMSVLEVSTL